MCLSWNKTRFAYTHTGIVLAAVLLVLYYLPTYYKGNDNSSTFSNSITFTFYEVDIWCVPHKVSTHLPTHGEPPPPAPLSLWHYWEQSTFLLCRKVTFPRRFPASRRIRFRRRRFNYVLVIFFGSLGNCFHKINCNSANVLEIAYGKRNYYY